MTHSHVLSNTQALELVHKFLTEAPEEALTCVSAPRRTPTVVDANSRPEVTPDWIGECEFKYCAQCVVLLLRTTSKEALIGRKLSPLGLLGRSAALFQMCAEKNVLQQPLLSAGILGSIMPLLTKVQPRSTSEAGILLKPVLRAIVSLSHAISDQHYDQGRELAEALLPFLSDPTPACVAELAIEVVKNMARHDCLRGVVVEGGLIPALVSVCRGAGARAKVAEESARALGNIALDEAYELQIVERGGTQALLHLLSADNLSSSVADAAYEALANLIDCAAARHILAAKGGIKVSRTTLELICRACRALALASCDREQLIEFRRF